VPFLFRLTMHENEDSLPPDIRASDLANYYGVRWFHVYVLATVMMTIAVQGSVAGSTPFLLDAIKAEFQISDSKAAFTATSVILGSIVGVFLTGRMSDVYGRRLTTMICICAMMVISCAHYYIPGGSQRSAFYILLLLRTLMGIPYAATIVVTFPLLTEFFPDSLRGTIVPISLTGWNLGVIYLVNCMPMLGDNAPWRYVYAVGPLAPSLLALCMLYLLPESPRWLLTQGNTEEAQKSLSVVFASSPILGRAYVGPAPHVDATDLKNAGTYDLAEQSTRKTLRHCFSLNLLCATIVSTVLYFLLAAGANTFWAWGPDMLEIILGRQVSSEIFTLAEWSSVVGLVFTAAVIDQVPRRLFLSAGFALMAICIMILNAGKGLGPRTVEVSLILFKCVDAAGWTLVPLYASEIFPTVLRGTAFGFVLIIGRIGSVVCPAVAGIWIREFVHAVLSFIIGMFLVGAALGSAIPKEMSSQPMDDTIVGSEAAKII